VVDIVRVDLECNRPGAEPIFSEPGDGAAASQADTEIYGVRNLGKSADGLYELRFNPNSCEFVIVNVKTRNESFIPATPGNQGGPD